MHSTHSTKPSRQLVSSLFKKDEFCVGMRFRFPRADRLHAIVRQVAANDALGWFTCPIDDRLVPDYKKFVKKPRCFNDIAMNFHQEAYSVADQVLEDVRLIFKNARAYNDPVRGGQLKNADVLTLAQRLSDEFEAQVRSFSKAGGKRKPTEDTQELQDITPPKVVKRRRVKEDKPLPRTRRLSRGRAAETVKTNHAVAARDKTIDDDAKMVTSGKDEKDKPDQTDQTYQKGDQKEEKVYMEIEDDEKDKPDATTQAAQPAEPAQPAQSSAQVTEPSCGDDIKEEARTSPESPQGACGMSCAEHTSVQQTRHSESVASETGTCPTASACISACSHSEQPNDAEPVEHACSASSSDPTQSNGANGANGASRVEEATGAAPRTVEMPPPPSMILLDGVFQERDTLRSQLADMTAERDKLRKQLQSHEDQVRSIKTQFELEKKKELELLQQTARLWEARAREQLKERQREAQQHREHKLRVQQHLRDLCQAAGLNLVASGSSGPGSFGKMPRV